MRKIICFHNPEEANGCFSNWYLSDFCVKGIRFSSMEQYMMYQKAVLFQDTETAEERRFDRKEWQGQNLLGFSLMCVRTALVG